MLGAGSTFVVNGQKFFQQLQQCPLHGDYVGKTFLAALPYHIVVCLQLIRTRLVFKHIFNFTGIFVFGPGKPTKCDRFSQLSRSMNNTQCNYAGFIAMCKNQWILHLTQT